MQLSLLPPSPSHCRRNRVPGRAAQSVAGDAIDAFSLPDGHVASPPRRLRSRRGCGDGVGVGVPQLLPRLSDTAIVLDANGRARDPADVCAILDRRLGQLRTQAGDRYLTMCYALFNPSARSVRVACAGHPAPLMIESRGREIEARYLETSGPPIGMELGLPFTQSEFALGQSGEL